MAVVKYCLITAADGKCYNNKPECYNDGQPMELKSHAVIGQYGSGRSNLIGAQNANQVSIKTHFLRQSLLPQLVADFETFYGITLLG